MKGPGPQIPPPPPLGTLTCEAYGTFEGAAHALEAVLNEVTEELGWGVEHLVTQLTLMVDAFLCKEDHSQSVTLQTTATGQEPQSSLSLVPRTRAGVGAVDAETHPSSRRFHLGGVQIPEASTKYLALEGIVCCDFSCCLSKTVHKPRPTA